MQFGEGDREPKRDRQAREGIAFQARASIGAAN